MSARAEANRKAYTTPASAEIAPVTTNSQNLMRFTRTPLNRAASSLAPMAKMERPIPVKCSTTPKMTASTMNTTNGFGIWVPANVPKPQLVILLRKIIADDGRDFSYLFRHTDHRKRISHCGSLHAVLHTGAGA